MMTLCQAPAGSNQTVKWFYGDKGLRDEAAKLGVSPGEKVKIVGTFFGSVIVRSADGHLVALGSDVAEHIRI